MISTSKFRKEVVPTYAEAKAQGIIDKKCIPICDLFNDIGLKTEFCCQGHYEGQEFKILFDFNLPDCEIINFIKMVGDANNGSKCRGKFSKWHRYADGFLLSSWMYISTGSIAEIDEDIRIDLLRFQKVVDTVKELAKLDSNIIIYESSAEDRA